MEKLPMCRICLVENVRMYVVVNRNLHKLYEKLTDIPFVTEDIRPILACFFCCTKLKQSYQLLTQCLEAEELFAQRTTEDYKPSPVKIQDHYGLSIGLVKSPVVHISVCDECQTESIAIKEEFPAVCEGLDDLIEPKEEHESDGATVAKEPKLETLKIKLEDAITPEQTKKENSSTQDTRITGIGTSYRGAYFIEPYKYDKCNFIRVKKNTHHTPTQIGEKHKCGVCQRSFSGKGNLTKHIRIHTGEKPYTCDVCQQSFSVKGSLTKHTRIHTGQKPYKCEVCQQSFTDNCNLSRHIRIHTGEKPYKCNVCPQSFHVKISLTKHIRIHTGEKPYKCNICQRSFREKAHLTKHIRIHTGEKPYKCDVCRQSFSEKGNLTKHFRIHTGEKPYKCDICQCPFSEKVSLTKHFRIHTGQQPH